MPCTHYPVHSRVYCRVSRSLRSTRRSQLEPKSLDKPNNDRHHIFASQQKENTSTLSWARRQRPTGRAIPDLLTQLLLNHFPCWSSFCYARITKEGRQHGPASHTAFSLGRPCACLAGLDVQCILSASWIWRATGPAWGWKFSGTCLGSYPRSSTRIPRHW
jgi:hypothetical protein